jgi:lipopolysaccharide assembly protein A
MRIIKILIILIIMLVGGVFAVLNAQPVDFNFYFGSYPIALALLLSVALGAGILIGVLSALGMLLNLKREVATLKHRERLAREEVKNLRELPLHDQ